MSGENPSAALASREPAIAPTMRTSPRLGVSRPPASFINVDLPAPLRPTRPTTSAPTDSDTSISADTCPYHLLTDS